MKKFQVPAYKTITTPSNPDAGFLKLYFKSDGILYKLDSSGVEQAIGVAGATAWGAITGTLGDQTDLQNALDAKIGMPSIVTQPTGASITPPGGHPIMNVLRVDLLDTNTTINNPSGTYQDGAILFVTIRADSGGPFAITWGGGYDDALYPYKLPGQIEMSDEYIHITLQYFASEGLWIPINSVTTESPIISLSGNIVDNTDPANPVINGVQSVTGTAVDNTDPANPVINTTGGGGITFSAISANQNAVADNGYIMNGTGIRTLTLPVTCPVGAQIEVVGAAADGWILAQNASQVVRFGIVSSTTGTGGLLNSTHKRDSIRLVCTVADTEFTVISSVGNINVI